MRSLIAWRYQASFAWVYRFIYVRYLTQQEMAALADTVREVVGRALRELEAAEVIEMRQGRAVVVNHGRLRMLSSG